MAALDTTAAALPRAGMRCEEGEEGERRSWDEEKRWRAESQWRNLATVTDCDSLWYTGPASSW